MVVVWKRKSRRDPFPPFQQWHSHIKLFDIVWTPCVSIWINTCFLFSTRRRFLIILVNRRGNQGIIISMNVCHCEK